MCKNKKRATNPCFARSRRTLYLVSDTKYRHQIQLRYQDLVQDAYYAKKECAQMNQNVELLNYIYQNSQMGIETLDQLMSIPDDAEFRKLLQSQYNEYKTINDDAKSMAHKLGYEGEGLGFFEKMRTELMIDVQTMMDKSTSHISEMLMTGSNMGIINAIKNLKKYQNAHPEIRGLMEKLLQLEENNYQELKQYLS